MARQERPLHLATTARINDMEPTETTSPRHILAQPLEAPRPRGGEGQDRRLEQRFWTRQRIALIVIAVLVIGLVALAVSTYGSGKRLTVDADRLTISVAERGPFQEYIAVTGLVQPIRTIFLDAVLGGQVEQRFVQEGEHVEAGQPLVRLSNDQMTLQMLSNEAALQEQINGLRNTRLALDQNELSLRQQVAELDYGVDQLARETARNRELVERGAIPRRDYEMSRDEYTYLQRRLELTLQSYRQDSLARSQQLRQMEQQMSRLQHNLGLLQVSRENLVVRAPISGQLSALDAEIGAARAAGSRLGQIDDLSGWRLRVPVDEHYIARVTAGQRGTATVGGREVVLYITTVYPEVREGRFEVDMEFQGEEPAVRRGQSVRIRLELDQPEDALLLPRGGFFTTTGGHWAFVIGENGEAVRRPINIGRQNPQHFEVLEGLAPGDRVVTSSYETFGDADRLLMR
jgi:HlyD family secretion protein